MGGGDTEKLKMFIWDAATTNDERLFNLSTKNDTSNQKKKITSPKLLVKIDVH